jgi:tetraacyldisaccharide 4'-kinase
LGILSSLYKNGLTIRSLLYRKGIKKTRKLPFKVISIGNLTLGGTGKTPAVIAVAREAKDRGLKPCILTRGYKGRAKGPCLADDKNKELFNTSQTGDETLLMVYSLKDVPVVRGTNRFLSGVYALGELGPESINMFILDDGFQHWSLYRDVDIILIDASNPFGNERLFPEGILREPIDSVRRADIVVITKSDMVNETAHDKIIQTIKQYNTDAPVYTAQHKPISLISALGKTRNVNSLSNHQVYAFAAIANPSYFTFMLQSLGADIKKYKKFRDHHFYSQRELNKIQREAQDMDIITTEKDLVKLKELKLPENIYALKIEFSIEDNYYDTLFRKIADSTP